jgi:hypothetical protein
MLKTLQRDPESLERNFSGERTFAVSTIRRMLEKCAGIGCVTDAQGRRLGTGFLIGAEVLGLGPVGDQVFVTNAHVISPSVQGALPPDEAWVSFELECAAKNQPVSHKVVSPVLFSSPPGHPGITATDRLDVTVVALHSWPEGGTALLTNDRLPMPSRKTKVFVVGHPSGDALQLSLHDSELLDVCDEERLLHYRTPTEPGSSGSPVFNMDWEWWRFTTPDRQPCRGCAAKGTTRPTRASACGRSAVRPRRAPSRCAPKSIAPCPSHPPAAASRCAGSACAP